jgi:hypothetical protein
MTGGGAARLGTVFFRRTLRSKNIFFLTEALNSATFVSYLFPVPCSLFPFFSVTKYRMPEFKSDIKSF